MSYDKDENVTPYDKDEHVMPYDRGTVDMPYDLDTENMPDDSDNVQLPAKYANDYEIVLDKQKYDENMTNDEPNDVVIKDVVVYKRENNILSKEKRPIQ